MGAGPVCCITPKAQYREKDQPNNTIMKKQESNKSIIHNNNQSALSESSHPCLLSNDDPTNQKVSQANSNLVRQLQTTDSRTKLTLVNKTDLQHQTLKNVQSQKVLDVRNQENYNLNNENIDKSIQGWIQGKEKSTVIVKNAANAELNKDNTQFVGRSISKINATVRSSKQVSLMNSNVHSKNGKKKKGKKKKKGVAKNQPQPSLIINSSKNQTKNDKTNTNMMESKSVDFQITYIERKQDSFYQKGSITNVTNFLRSANITNEQLAGLRSTRFMNQKSINQDEQMMFSDLILREKMNSALETSMPNRSRKYLDGRPSEEQKVSQHLSKPNFQQPGNGMVKSPYFNHSHPDSDAITTKNERSVRTRQYPVIGTYQDDYEIASGGGQLAGDVDEDYCYEQGDPLEDEDDESFEKEGISPNEACYIDVDPIELNNLIPLNDSIALIRAVQYKGRTKMIDSKAFHLWEPTIHERANFYNSNPSPYTDEKVDIKLGIDQVWKRIGEISKTPYLMKEEFQPSKIFIGESSSESIVCALISVINHDLKFSTNYIGQSLYPQNMVGNKSILQNSKPILNKHGKYGVKLFLNGAERLIDIDDRLVFDVKKQKHQFCTYEPLARDDFCLALIEKAFCKLYGGYDSMSKLQQNPSIDIHHLTNWIPETVNFEDLNNKESLWGRLLQNFREQNIIICLQENVIDQDLQGSRSQGNGIKEQKRFYAVLDLIETNDLKIIQCKSPYKNEKRLMQFIHDNSQLPMQFQRENKLVLDTGVFYMVWQDDISDYFSCITLCWNPKIYPFIKSVTTKFDFTLDRNIKFNQPQFSVYNCPQVLFTIPPHQEDFEIRIMLRKHVKSFQVPNKIQFKLFTFDGQRIVYPNETLRNSLPNSREIMSDVFIFENSQEYECYVLVLINEGDEDMSKIYEYFTLDVYSFIDVDLKELPMPSYDKQYVLSGQWCQKQQKQMSNAGGLGASQQTTAGHGGSNNKNSIVQAPQQIIYNPQYRIKVFEPTHVQLNLDTIDTYDVMLSIHQSGNGAPEEPFQNFLANSNQGFFVKGFGFMEIILDPMEYTLVITSQVQQNLGDFRVELKKIISSKFEYHKDFIIEELEPKGMPQEARPSKVPYNQHNSNKNEKVSQIEINQLSMKSDMNKMKQEQLNFKNQFNIEIRKMQDDITDLRDINLKFENKFDNLFSALTELADNQKKMQGNMLSIQNNVMTMDQNVSSMRSDMNLITNQIKNQKKQ